MWAGTQLLYWQDWEAVNITLQQWISLYFSGDFETASVSDAPWVTVPEHATRRLDKQTQLNFSSMWTDFKTGINQEEGGVGGGEGSF